MSDELASLTKLERLRIAPMAEAARLSSLSEDSLRRNHRDKIVKLGPRREGMRVMDALMLSEQCKGTKARSATT